MNRTSGEMNRRTFLNNSVKLIGGSTAVNVSSNPASADVSLDGNFIGNSTANLKLAPGKHTIVVKMAGWKDWTRDINVQSGSEVQLTASLEKAL